MKNQELFVLENVPTLEFGQKMTNRKRATVLKKVLLKILYGDKSMWIV
jgi:hypothetical protein